MAIFQASVLKKFLNQLDIQVVGKAYKQYVSYFHDATIQQNIRDSKEEQFQAKFLDELFVNILGYTLNPQPNFNLTTEFKNIKNSRKADGAILLNSDAIAVIELKSTKTRDLESIRQQAFDYKANQPGCVYVITSNFEKLRFYINNAVDFEEFDLFSMSYKEFELLYLCLHREHLLNHTPLKIKEASIHEEEAITKKFYADYSLFKRELFRDIVKKNLRNPELRELEEATGKKVLFKKTQKLLDRFLFIFFGEDRGLLPPNSISKILEQYEALKKMDAYAPLYDRYKKYFSYLNEGWKGQEFEIYAYNGGLFKPDPVLDTILIDDELLYKHTAHLTKYDFESQVDVNILGHIFEHSLNEIESVNAEIDGVEFDKQKTKRKKDGVFYTPKYITKYIVDNTVGKLAQEKKQELDIREEEYFKGSKNRPKTTLMKLDEKLETYRAWLLELTICDPACGSGAFLNQALEFLIAEHRWIDEMSSKLHGGGLVFPDIENSILEKNIYGVDLNDESVEIAKLSLWLRTAAPGRKLTSLNDNIKCGNSLIDVKAVAGDKAFNWEKEFPEVFAKGGFDVVIGNPPYVKLEAIKDVSEQLSKRGYKTFDKRGDLYVLFVERGFQILKPKGLISYIMPNKWLQAGYGKNLRSFMLTKRLISLIDFGDIQIFEGATTYPVIFIAQDDEPAKKFQASVLKRNGTFDFETNVLTNNMVFDVAGFNEDTWVISSNDDVDLLDRLNNSFPRLIQFINGGANYGIKTGFSEAFILEETTKQQICLDPNSKRFIKPFLQGRDISRFGSSTPYNYMVIIEKGYTKSHLGEVTEDEAWNWFENNHNGIANWLLPFEEKAKLRTDKGDFWWELRACDYYNLFEKPKIMYQVFQVKPCFIYDEQGLYCNNSMWIIPTDNKALLGILNSKMGWWLITKYCTQIQNGCQLIWKYFGQIPIPKAVENQPELTALVEKIIELTAQITKETEKFSKYLSSQFSLDKLSQKLQSWHELTFAQFITELNAAIKKAGGNKLSKLNEMEWMELFEAKKKEAQELKAEIERVDREIDQIVYELYGLSEEEIKIVEQ